MDKGKGAKRDRTLPLFLVVLGMVTVCLLIIVNRPVLSLFAPDGSLMQSRVARIHKVQLLLCAWGLLLMVLGFISYRLRLFRSLDRKPKRTSRYLLLAVVLYTAITAEIIFHIYPRLSTAERLSRSVAYTPSPYSVHRLADFEQTPLDASGKVMFTIRGGYRGDVFAEEKNDGELRIVFLGGSFVFDPESYGEDDWPRRIESIVHKAGYEEVRILNAGVPGHTTFDSIARLLAEIHAYKPDMVVLCHAWNDMKYFNRITVKQSPLRVNRPLLRETHGKFPPSLATRLADRIHLVRLIKALPTMFRGRLHDEGLIPETDLLDEVSELGIDQFRLNLRTFADVCRNIGARPVLLVQPSLVTLDNESEVRERVAYHWVAMTHRAVFEAFLECRKAMHGTAGEKSCAVWDFTGNFEGDTAYFVDHVHLSRDGSSAFARLIADSLIPELESMKAQRP